MSLGHCHLMRAELGQLGKVQELKSCDFSLQLALNEGNQFKVAHAPARPWPWARLGTRSGPSGTNCCTLCCSCSDYECDTSDKWAKLLVTDVDCSGPHQCQHCQWIFFPSSPRWLSLDIPNLVNPVMKKSWSWGYIQSTSVCFYIEMLYIVIVPTSLKIGKINQCNTFSDNIVLCVIVFGNCSSYSPEKAVTVQSKPSTRTGNLPKDTIFYNNLHTNIVKFVKSSGFCLESSQV